LFTTTTTTTTTADPNNIAAKGSAASLPIIPIAAAAGGGILLVVIVVIIVMRRRRNQAQNGAGDKRAVVAFENPMYETGKDGSQPVYDNKEGHEGLYDEPAFAAKTDKSNPVYNSNENLASDEFGNVAAHLKKQALPDDYDEPSGLPLQQLAAVYGDDYLQTQDSHVQFQPAADVDYLTAEDQPKGFPMLAQTNESDQQVYGDGYLDVAATAE
jgi:hypothetical protein